MRTKHPFHIAAAAIVAAAVFMGAGSCHSAKPAVGHSASGQIEPADYTPGTIIVNYDSTIISTTQLESVIAESGSTVIYRYNGLKALAVKIGDGTPIAQEMARLRKVKGVTRVQRDRILKLN